MGIKRQLHSIYSAEGSSDEEDAIHRQHINSLPAPTIVEITEEWPFLFSQR